MTSTTRATSAPAGHGEDEDDEDVPDSLIEMAEPVELGVPGPVLPPPRRWPRLLLALGFVLLAAAIVAGAIAIVGSVTHGFKKPVKVTYKKSAVFSLKTGECFDPQGQSYSLIPCDSPHDAEVFATFNLTGTTWPGSTGGRRGGERRLREQAHRLPEPATGGQPCVHLHLPGRHGLAGGHADRDLRGQGRERAAHRVGARGLGDRGLAAARRPGCPLARLRVVDDAVRGAADHRAEVDQVPVAAPGDE